MIDRSVEARAGGKKRHTRDPAPGSADIEVRERCGGSAVQVFGGNDEEAELDEKAERLFQLLRHIHDVKESCRARARGGASDTKAATPQPPWTPRFRSEDFGAPPTSRAADRRVGHAVGAPGADVREGNPEDNEDVAGKHNAGTASSVVRPPRVGGAVVPAGNGDRRSPRGYRVGIDAASDARRRGREVLPGPMQPVSYDSAGVDHGAEMIGRRSSDDAAFSLDLKLALW